MTGSALATGVVAVLMLAVAGAAGALLRHEVVSRCGPVGTRGRAAGVAVVNLAGAVIAAAASVMPLHQVVRSVVVTGFAGALTTFSTWVLDAVLAPAAGRDARVVAALDLVGQLAVGTAAVLAVADLL